MVADAVNTELFITINVSTCLPARPAASQALATLSRRRRPDVRGACVSPEGGTEAAECVAGARRPHHSPLAGRNLLF